MTDEYYMRQALQEAHKALSAEEVPIGAVIVCRGQIIARGHNLTERLHDVTAHAEMQAITAATEYLGGKYLTGALGWCQIPRVVYGAADEKRGFRRFAPQALHPRCEVVSGVLEEECSTLMKSFFQRKRR